MSAATLFDVRQEERAARERVRRQERLQRAAATARAREQRGRVAGAVRDTARAFPECRCELRGVSSVEQLRAMGAGCTGPRWVCARLDAVRRRLGA